MLQTPSHHLLHKREHRRWESLTEKTILLNGGFVTFPKKENQKTLSNVGLGGGRGRFSNGGTRSNNPVRVGRQREDEFVNEGEPDRDGREGTGSTKTFRIRVEGG